MIKTLVITKLPFPPVGGEHLRSWQNINLLSQLGPVHVFSIFRYDYDPPGPPAVKTWDSFNVNRQPLLPRQVEPALWWLRKRGLWDYWSYRYSAARQLRSLLSELKPDLVVIEELWLSAYLPEVARYGCPVILDHHNVEAPLFEATKCQGNGLRGWLRSRLHLPQIKADEQRVMRQTHQTWVCSHTDRSLLQKLYGTPTQPLSAKLFVVPNAINLQDYASIRAGQQPVPKTLPACNQYVLYLGNFGYVPNAEAADNLIQRIYPILKQDYPNSRLLLVGREPTQMMLAAAQNDPHIVVTGQVDDIRPYLAASSVMVVPLRRGSGTRFKVLEAFAAHRPVVSTAKGVEGLATKNNTHVLIRESAAELAAGVAQMWQQPEQTQTMIQNAYALAQEKYAWQAAASQVQQALSNLFPGGFAE